MRIDYSEHQAKFLELYADDQTLTVKVYCDAAGLNYASARRYLKNPLKTNRNAELLQEVKLSKKKASSRDWPEIYQRYLKQCLADPSLTMADFALSEGIQSPQVRKQFAVQRKSGVFTAQEDLVTAAQEEYQQEIAQYKVKSKSLNKRAKSVRGTGRGSAQQKSKAAQQNHDRVSDCADLSIPLSNIDSRDELGRFRAGHRFNVVHGGYARLTGLDPDILKIVTDVDPLNLSTEILTVRSQYLSMIKYLNEEKTAIIEMYANGEPLKEFDGETDKTLNKALAEVEISLSGKLRALESSIANFAAITAKIETDYIKLQQKAFELPSVDTATGLALRKRILKDREIKKWSPLETAQRFEYYGLKVPDTIMEEAKREIAAYEPIVDEEGLTDDQLDELTNQYRERQRRVIEEDLPRQKDELEQRIAEFEAIDAGANNVGTEQSQSSTEDRWGDEDDLTVYTFDDLSDFESLSVDGDE